MLIDLNEKLHIVIFIPSIETGGVERNTIIVANYLVSRGYKVSLVYVRAVDGMLARFDDGVGLINIGGGKPLPYIHPRINDAVVVFKGFIAYLRYSSKHNNHVVVLSFQSNIVSVLASRFAGIPVAARVSNHPSHTRYETSKLQKISERLKLVVYRLASAVITNSNVTSSYFESRLPVMVKTIYNPIDFELLDVMLREQVDHPWLVAERDYKIVVAVGRLVSQKNFSVLIKAFSKLPSDLNSKLIIIGEGEERRKLESLINDLGLDDRVDLIGYRKNVHPFVSKADLFVLSSNFEGLPNALIEAIAVGTPAVSTNCLSGPAEILCEGNAGDLVPINDSDSLSVAINENLINSERTDKLFSQAEIKIREFDKNITLREYEDLLRFLAGFPVVRECAVDEL